MIDIYFYNITKRLNSTARPTGTGVKYECVFKENTSLLNPSFKLRLLTKPDYNYFKFDNRFYWITDIISLNNDLWQISGRIDALATYKGHISATSAFVLYDSTPNTQLPDSRLAIETDVETHTTTANMPWGFSTDSDAGTYFIATVGAEDTLDIDFSPSSGGIINATLSAQSRNGTGVYAIPYSSIMKIGFDISDFIDSLMDIMVESNADITYWKTYLNNAIAGATPNNLTETLAKVITGVGNVLIDTTTEYPTRVALLLIQNLIGGGNALQNVKASYWLPFNIPSSALDGHLNSSTKLALGTYTDIVPELARVSDPVITAVDIPVTIPWQFEDWRDVSCTEIMLYIPLIGCVAIPPEVVKGNDTIYCRFSLNLYSGELACEVRCDGGQIATYGANSAMNILIGDSNINMGGIVNTVMAGVTHQYAGVVEGAVNTLSGMNTSVGGIGGGAGTGLTDVITCVVRTHNTSQEPSALLSTIGTPTRQLKTLSGSGYCQTMNAQLNCGTITGEPDPTQTEIEMVNTSLDTGVYLE